MFHMVVRVKKQYVRLERVTGMSSKGCAEGGVDVGTNGGGTALRAGYAKYSARLRAPEVQAPHTLDLPCIAISAS